MEDQEMHAGFTTCSALEVARTAAEKLGLGSWISAFDIKIGNDSTDINTRRYEIEGRTNIGFRLRVRLWMHGGHHGKIIFYKNDSVEGKFTVSDDQQSVAVEF